MEYKGKLYAKIANKYLEISHTDKFEQLEIEANYSDMLIKELESLKKENEGLKAKYNECMKNNIC